MNNNDISDFIALEIYAICLNFSHMVCFLKKVSQSHEGTSETDRRAYLFDKSIQNAKSSCRRSSR